MMCINNETWSPFRLNINIQSTAESIISSFHLGVTTNRTIRAIKWNYTNHTGTVLNVDGSYIDGHAGYGGLLRNSAGHYLSGFSGYIPNTDDILLAELTAIHQGLLTAIDKGLTNLVCYSDSQISIDLILRDDPQFHIYAVLIHDIKDLVANYNFSLLHTLREGNQCADILAKKGATSDAALVIHSSPPDVLLAQLKADALGTFFPRI
jgi:ribonuclease HI